MVEINDPRVTMARVKPAAPVQAPTRASPAPTPVGGQIPIKPRAAQTAAPARMQPQMSAPAKPKIPTVRIDGHVRTYQSSDPQRSSSLTFDASGSIFYRAPGAILFCLRLFFMPLRLISFVADTLLSIVLLSIFMAVLLWAFGVLPNELVEPFLTSLGDRGLDLLAKLGLEL
jgi:hypothetical protein